MVSTKVFGTFSIGSSPIEVTINFLLWCNGSTGGSNPLSKGSNPLGRTKRIYMKDKELIINEMLSSSLKMIESIDKLIRYSGLENTQEFIEWQDTINAISVK